jgi:hypothetical protein
MSDHVRDTLLEMERLASQHECVAVGFSGGKDSLTVLDIAVRTFRKVVPYFYYFVPGLKCEEGKLEIARTRYNLEVLRYPSAEGIKALRLGAYCDEYAGLDSLPDMSRRTLYNWIKADTGASIILTGEKKADGFFRRRRMANQKNRMADVIFPLREWLRWEVLSYLKAQQITIPDAGRGDSGSVCLLDAEILHLHKHHPEDYETLRSFFPYIEAVVLREQWFGPAPAPDPGKKEVVVAPRKKKARKKQAAAA